MKLDKHKIQGISLLIAVALLWIDVGLEHKTAMILSSIILTCNALMELKVFK